MVRYLITALMTVTLIWGGTLSCSLELAPVKSCCNPHGGCKEKPGPSQASRQCNLLPVGLSTAKAPVPAHPPTVAAAVLPADSSVFNAARHFVVMSAAPDHGSPPDLNLLHSVFRV
jgi:hypothetical protein